MHKIAPFLTNLPPSTSVNQHQNWSNYVPGMSLSI